MHAAEITPNSYAVCLETLGDEVTIHPPRKQEVADMMALRALSSAYGINVGMTVDYPEPQSIEYLEDGRVKIRLTNVWSNLQSISARKIVGFEVAGEDRQFQLADAEVDWDGQTIFVHCDAVPKPVAVRYSFRNWMGANMQTSYGIPVPPFRSDDWPL
jgi:sialate O-acetylesterase